MADVKGKLIAIGGREDKDKNMKILSHFVEECGGRDAYIEVITTATNLPEEVGDDYMDAFDHLDARNARVLHIDDRDDAHAEKNVRIINDADGIFFAGGNQLKLTAILGGTPVFDAIKARYKDSKFVIAGTSAGAAGMPGSMIINGKSEFGLIKGKLSMSPGLGLIPDVIIDTHFTQRGRFSRLIHAIALNPSCIGIGLAEDTAVVVENGCRLNTIGSGLVVIVDGSQIEYTNISEVHEGDPISIERVYLHVLSQGDCFLLDTRKFEARDRKR